MTREMVQQFSGLLRAATGRFGQGGRAAAAAASRSCRVTASATATSSGAERGNRAPLKVRLLRAARAACWKSWYSPRLNFHQDDHRRRLRARGLSVGESLTGLAFARARSGETTTPVRPGRFALDLRAAAARFPRRACATSAPCRTSAACSNTPCSVTACPRFPSSAPASPPPGAHSAVSRDMGAMSAYGCTVGDFHVAIVGEVPLETVRMIGDGIRAGKADATVRAPQQPVLQIRRGGRSAVAAWIQGVLPSRRPRGIDGNSTWKTRPDYSGRGFCDA